MDGLVVDKWFNLINEKREYAGEIHLVIQMRMCAEYRQYRLSPNGVKEAEQMRADAAAAAPAIAAAAERNRVAQVERERVAKEKEDRLQVYLQSLSPRDRLKHDAKIQCMMIFGENVDMEVLDRLLGEGVKRSNATEGVSKRVTYVCVCVCVLCVFMCVYVCVCTLYQGSLCNVAPALLSIH